MIFRRRDNSLPMQGQHHSTRALHLPHLMSPWLVVGDVQGGRTIAAFPSFGSRGSGSSERSLGRSESSGEGEEGEEAGEPPGASSSGGFTHSSSGGPDPASSALPARLSAAGANTLSPRKRMSSSKPGPSLGARRSSAEQSSVGLRHSGSGSHPDWNEGEDFLMLGQCLEAGSHRRLLQEFCSSWCSHGSQLFLPSKYGKTEPGSTTQTIPRAPSSTLLRLFFWIDVGGVILWSSTQLS